MVRERVRLADLVDPFVREIVCHRTTQVGELCRIIEPLSEHAYRTNAGPEPASSSGIAPTRHGYL